MEGLRIDKTLHPFLAEKVRSGELSEAGLRALIYQDLGAPLAVDRVLEKGEGELSEETCNRIRTELPPGLYRYITVTDDRPKPKTLVTIYMRTVDSVLDELWPVRAWKKMSPNPLDFLPDRETFIPSLVGQPASRPRTAEDNFSRTKVLPDALGSQGVKGTRPTLKVQFEKSSDHDHRWQFPGFRVRSTVLAPALLQAREMGIKKISVKQLRAWIEGSSSDRR